MSTNTGAAILGRVIEPSWEELSPDAARSILKLNFLRADRERMDELASKSRDGSLEPDEQVELTEYLRVGHLLNLMRSRARLALKRPGPAGSKARRAGRQ